ncbi:MAG: HpcH/HpaI aldolase/citrate lyase family protein [Planctomycetota bacterium]
MQIPQNKFKQALKEGRLQIGLWSSLCSNIAVEVIGDSGFDWILIDSEHAPNELSGIVTQLQALSAASAANTTAIVRPAWLDTVAIKRILDIGAQSILVPYVQTEAEARLAVASVRYPPAGIRGVAPVIRASHYGRISNYLADADSQICLLVQVETAAAMTQLEAIASVEGVDGVFIGPSDLAASLGHLGNPAHTEVQAVLRNAATRLKTIGKPAGILTSNAEEARRYIEWGYTFVAVGTDINVLRFGADALVKSFKH